MSITTTRSLITKVILFDEPLSNLDAKLREQMLDEIVRLQKEVGITSVFVTHDQSEALVMSDRVVIKKRTTQTLELVGLDHLAERYATKLSGGQRQRVALAQPDGPSRVTNSPGECARRTREW